MNTIQLIGVGTVEAIPASEVKVGDERLYNYYGTSVIVKIIEKSPKTLTFITYSEEGKYFITDIRKTTLVAINKSGLDVSAHTPNEAYSVKKRAMVDVSEYFPVVEEVSVMDEVAVSLEEAMEELTLEQYHLELQEKGMTLSNSNPSINPDSTYKVIVSKDRETNQIGEYEKVLTGKELEFQLFMNEVLEIVEEVETTQENDITESTITDQQVTNEQETKLNNTVTVHNNEERNSVELSFSSKPDEDTRSLMKSHGFRWARVNRVWYKKNPTESDYNMINTLTNSEISYNSETVESRPSFDYPEIEINDIESYTVPQDIQDREHETGWIFRGDKVDHTKQLQEHFTEYNNKVIELLETTDNSKIAYELKKSLQYFKKNYHEAYIKYLSAKAAQPSWAITGRSGLNVNRYNKNMSRIDSHMHKLNELQEDYEKRFNKAKKEIMKDEQRKITEAVQGTDINITFKMKKKEFTYMGITENRKVHCYEDYWIAKTWGSFKVFKSNKLIHDCKSTETLDHAIKYTVYHMQQENKKAV